MLVVIEFLIIYLALYALSAGEFGSGTGLYPDIAAKNS